MTHPLARDLVPGAGTADDARAWLADADKILLTAGAGLSAAAGYDYGDTARFAELFPALYAAGFRARYELIGAPLSPLMLWGFWAVHTTDIRFDPRPNPLYAALRDLVGDTDHFALTSNVDALFARNGFDPDRVFTPQGDYGLYQCITPCTRQVWESRPVIEQVLAGYDPATGAASPETVPACPVCGGATYLNVNAGPNYIGDHFWPTGRALESWLAEDRDSKIVVLEIGAGFNTPSVVRWPSDQITRALPAARLVRVNPVAAGVPVDLVGRAASLGLSAGEAVVALAVGGSTN